MERLTFKTDGLNGFSDRDLAVYGGIQSDGSEIYIGSVADKLAEYEDLEEQGRLLKLPCNIGDWVFVIKNKHIDFHKIVSIEVSDDGVYCKSDYRFSKIDDFGKTVFLTREEAEAALKELCTSNRP